MKVTFVLPDRTQQVKYLSYVPQINWRVKLDENIFTIAGIQIEPGDKAIGPDDTIETSIIIDLTNISFNKKS